MPDPLFSKTNQALAVYLDYVLVHPLSLPENHPPASSTMKSFAAAAAASLCALAPATAFVPGVPLAGVRSAAPSKLSMAATPERSVSIPIDPYPEGLDGEMVGDVGFDPAGFANNPPAWVQGPGAGTAGRVRWYREAELAHGRVAMLAAAGWIFPEIYHFPGNSVLGPDRFAEMNPLVAYGNIPSAGGIQIVVTLLILETIRLNRSIRNPDGVPGDIGLGQGEGRWNPFNFNYSEEEYAEKQLQVGGGLSLCHGPFASLSLCLCRVFCCVSLLCFPPLMNMCFFCACVVLCHASSQCRKEGRHAAGYYFMNIFLYWFLYALGNMLNREAISFGSCTKQAKTCVNCYCCAAIYQ